MTLIGFCLYLNGITRLHDSSTCKRGDEGTFRQGRDKAVEMMLASTNL